MVDNIVQLEMRLGETMERTIRIVKARGSGHDSRHYPLRISKQGIAVARKDRT